jgi:NADPH:quinone reductase
MPYPRIIPHSDGAGRVDQLGAGGPADWLGRSVWCYGAQSYRAFGTAAEFTVVPLELVVPLPETVAMEQGACLGIPGITAHRAVHVAGPASGRTVLVQGAAGSVGLCALQLARRAGARVIGTIRTSADEENAKNAGAHEVVRNDNDVEFKSRMKELGSRRRRSHRGVAFGANITSDVDLLKMNGSIAAYATNIVTPTIPFWLMVFKNIRLFFLGSDDFSKEDKVRVTRDLNASLEASWSGFEIAERVPLWTLLAATNSSSTPRDADELSLRCDPRATLGCRSSAEKFKATLSLIGSPGRHDQMNLRASVYRTVARETPTHPLRTLRHTAQPPVSMGLGCQKFLEIEPASVITTDHPELALLIIESHFYPRSSRVAISVGHRFSCNAENFVHHVALKSIAASPAFDRAVNCRNATKVSGDALD